MACIERERERGVLFEFCQFVFLLWELVYVFQSFVSIFAKNLIVRESLAVSILEYNINQVGRASESVLVF